MLLLQVASGSRVSNPLVAALEVIHAGDMPAVEAEIACLAWQQLQAMPTSLLHDLALLVTDAVQTADEEGIQRYSGLLRHYAQVGDDAHVNCDMSTYSGQCFTGCSSRAFCTYVSIQSGIIHMHVLHHTFSAWKLNPNR